VIVQGALNN